MKLRLLIVALVLLFPLNTFAAVGQGVTTWSPLVGSLVDADYLAGTDVSDTSQSTSGSSRKITLSQLRAYLDASYVLKNAAIIPTATTDGATITFDLSLGDSPFATIGGNRTLAFSNPVAGQWHQLRIIQPATGGPYTVTWPATGFRCSFLDADGVPTYTAPALKTLANSESKFTIHTTSSTTAECTMVNP